MNCKIANKKISLFVDGLLDDKETMLLMEHIDSCDSCRNYLIEMQKTISILKEFPKAELSYGFENKMHFAFKREVEVKKKSKLFKASMIAMPVTVAVFAAIIGFNYVFSGGLSKSEMAMEKSNDMIEMTVAGSPKMDANSAPEAEMAKSEAAPMEEVESFGVDAEEETEEMAIFDESIEDKELRGLGAVVINVTLVGETYSDFQYMIDELTEPLELKDFAMITQEDSTIVIVELSSMHVLMLFDQINYYEYASFDETQDVQNLTFDDNDYYEVTFLFQQNNN